MTAVYEVRLSRQLIQDTNKISLLFALLLTSFKRVWKKARKQHNLVSQVEMIMKLPFVLVTFCFSPILSGLSSFPPPLDIFPPTISLEKRSPRRAALYYRLYLSRSLCHYSFYSRLWKTQLTMVSGFGWKGQSGIFLQKNCALVCSSFCFHCYAFQSALACGETVCRTVVP